MIRTFVVRNDTVSFMNGDERNLTASDYSNYNADLQSRDGFRESTVPVQLVLITYEAGTEIPYRLSFFSPGSYTYIEMDAEAYSTIITRTELHTHNTYELSLVRDGTLSQRIEAERHIYPKGSCFLLNRNVRHNEEYDSSFSTITLSISERFLQDTLRDEFMSDSPVKNYWEPGTDLSQFLIAELNQAETGKKSYIDFIPSGDGTEAAEIFEEMAATMLDPGPGHTFLIKSQLCRLLSLLTKKELYSTRPVELGSATEGRIFGEITRILEERNGRVSRNELSRKLHYSGNYINRLSNKFTGTNLTDYANTIAMRKAASMLLTTDLTVSEIAEQLSFSNRRYFYKEFEKTYGTTPRLYRVANKDVPHT